MSSGSQSALFSSSTNLSGIGIDHQPRLVDRFEVRSLDGIQLIDERVVVPIWVVQSADIPVSAGAVVGHEHAILLERRQNDFHLWIKRGRNWIRSFQAEAQPHRRRRGARAGSRRMAARPDIALRAVYREAQRVGDYARGNLVIARQARQDRQARRIGRRPAIGAQDVRRQRENGPEPSCQLSSGCLCESQVSYSLQFVVSTISTWRSP